MPDEQTAPPPPAPVASPLEAPASAKTAQGETEPPNATIAPIEITDAMREQLAAFNVKLIALLAEFRYALVATPYLENGVIMARVQVSINLAPPVESAPVPSDDVILD